MSALTAAVLCDNTEMIRLLVRHGADPNQRGDSTGKSILFGGTALKTAIHLRKSKAAKTLIGLGADVNDLDQGEETPLMAAEEGALRALHSENGAEGVACSALGSAGRRARATEASAARATTWTRFS